MEFFCRPGIFIKFFRVRILEFFIPFLEFQSIYRKEDAHVLPSKTYQGVLHRGVVGQDTKGGHQTLIYKSNNMEREMNNTYPADIAALIDDMKEGRYKNLQIMLFRNHPGMGLGLGLGQQYLVVSRDGFGVYKLLDINYCEGVLKMELTNSLTGEPFIINLDVNDQHPEYVFLFWEDIKNMVLDDIAYRFSGDDSPELEKM